MFSFRHSISSCNNPFARLLFRTENGVRKSRQHSVVAANSESRSSLSLLALKGHHDGFRIRHDTLTAATLAITRRSFSKTLTKTRNSPSSGSSKPFSSSPSSPSLGLPTSKWSEKQIPIKAPARNSPTFWSIEENRTMLELMRDKVKPKDMLPYFPERAPHGIRKHTRYLCQRLTTLGATPLDLYKNDIMTTMLKNMHQPLRWSEEQDELLQSLYKQHGSDWKLIATLVSEQRKDGHQQEWSPRRDSTECRTQIEATNLDFNRGPWSMEELERFWKSVAQVNKEHGFQVPKIVQQNAGNTMGSGNSSHENGNSDGSNGGGGERVPRRFWELVSEKVQTRSPKQCSQNYRGLKIGRTTEGGIGREKQVWTIEELEALRDMYEDRRVGWGSKGKNKADREANNKSDYSNNNYSNNNNNNNNNNNETITDTQPTKALWLEKYLMLKEKRTDNAIRVRAAHIGVMAKEHSISKIEYLNRMIAKKRRLGLSELQMKEREGLIAEKLIGAE